MVLQSLLIAFLLYITNWLYLWGIVWYYVQLFIYWPLLAGYEELLTTEVEKTANSFQVTTATPMLERHCSWLKNQWTGLLLWTPSHPLDPAVPPDSDSPPVPEMEACGNVDAPTIANMPLLHQFIKENCNKSIKNWHLCKAVLGVSVQFFDWIKTHWTHSSRKSQCLHWLIPDDT